MDEPEPAPAEASDELVARLARASAERPDGVDRYTPPPSGFDPGWITIGVGISVAGGVYPSVATVLVVVVGGFVAVASGNPTDVDLIEILGGAGTAMVLGGGLAACMATILSVPLLLTARAMLRLLRVRTAWMNIGAFCGGAVAFVLWSPVCYRLGHTLLASLHQGDLQQTIVESAPWVSAGPLLAILVGQVGGAYGGLVLERAGISYCPPDTRGRPGRISFSIGQLFSLTLILSLALTALRMVGLLNAAMLLALACWLGLQVALRRPAIWIAERVIRFLRRPKPRGYLIASGMPTDSEGAVR